MMTDKAKLLAFFDRAAAILEACEETQAAFYFKAMADDVRAFVVDEDGNPRSENFQYVLPQSAEDIGAALGV